MQILTRLSVITTILLFALSGCGTSPRSGGEPAFTNNPEVVYAAQLFSQQQYAMAADHYLQLVVKAPQNAKNLMRLMAAESQLRAEQPEQARQTLALVTTNTLTPDEDLRYRLIQAELALDATLPAQALEILGAAPADTSPVDLKQRFYHDQAQAYLMKQETLNWILALEQLDLVLLNHDHQLANQLDILNNLGRASDEQLAGVSVPDNQLHSGWVELSRILRSYRHDPQLAIGPYREWQNLYPSHPALPELLSNYFSQRSIQELEIDQIAVLLPLTGKFAEAADVIRNGLMMAWYETPPGQRPDIRFYDSAHSDEIWPLINQVSDQGADIIIGPLKKDSVLQLARAGELPVPVLALNQVVTDRIPPENLYQYALSPEDEARQVAEWAWSKGLGFPAVISPATPNGDRLQSAFAERWLELSDHGITLEQYDPGTPDHATAIQHMLLLDESRVRNKRLQRILGTQLEFEPRRRGDTDFIFAIGNSQQIQQIKPLLQFYFAGELPLFSTSKAWNGTVSRQQAFDIKGTEIPDMPWLIGNATTAVSRETVLDSFSRKGDAYLRLYPMGMDAYRLVYALRRLEHSVGETMKGDTGLLYLDSNKHILRRLTWISLNEQPEILGVTPNLDRHTASYPVFSSETEAAVPDPNRP